MPPPTGPFRWSARDNVNYNETAALAALDIAAQQSKALLRNFYQQGRALLAQGLDAGALRFLDSRRIRAIRVRVAQLVALLHGAGHRGAARDAGARRSRKAASRRHLRGAARPALSKLCGRSAHAAALSEGCGRALRRYLLGTAGELPPEAVADRRSGVREAALRCSTEPPHPAGHVAGDGSGLRAARTPARRACSRRAFGCRASSIEIAEQPFSAADIDYPRGSWILPAQPGLDAALARRRRRAGARFPARRRRARKRARMRRRVPRLGVWVPWADTDTIGWVRYSLDQRQIPYVYVRDEDIRARQPARALSTCCSTATSISSSPSRSRASPRLGVPMPFKKTAATPSHGTPGRIGRHHGRHRLAGLAEIQRFVDRRRPAGHARQRLDAGARGRARARRAPRFGRRAAQRGGRRERRRGRRGVHRDAHAGLRMCA